LHLGSITPVKSYSFVVDETASNNKCAILALAPRAALRPIETIHFVAALSKEPRQRQQLSQQPFAKANTA